MERGHVAVIGASLAGLRTVEGLRRAGFGGRITLVGDEQHPPYTRPPLSKQVLAGTWEPERVWLRPPAKLDELDVDLRLGVRAESVDVDAHVVELADGPLRYDSLVVATGASPRRLPGDDLEGVHVLRRLDDAIALRDAVVEARRLVVVGAGFVGCEVAATALERGLEVTVVEPLPAPMLRGLGPELGEVAAALHRERGIDLRCGTGVAGLRAEGRVSGVTLSDGSTVDTDLVLVGIGVVPNVAWLAGSGIDVTDGVLCDATLAVERGDDVWAAGDVARWRHPAHDEPVRFEHWTVAAEHGRAVAESIVAGPGAAVPHAPVPYVWSDQLGTRIQIVGRPSPTDQVDVVLGSTDERRFLALLGRNGTLTGAVAFGMPKPLMALLAQLERGPLSVSGAREVAAA